MKSPSSRRGSTLIEAMAALVVFTVGILGVMQMNVLASRQNNLARGEVAAGKIARDLAASFERLPFNHPIFNLPGTVIPANTAAFTDFDNTSGRVLLKDVGALIGATPSRPLVSTAEAMVAVESNSTSGFGTYEVAWRSAPLTNPDPSDPRVDARVIVIMVRFRSIADTWRQVNVWTVKYDPEAVIDAGAAIQEI
ncbi:prepilin-type N-terminal cleavage/methylation domain-containing protein [Myxococcaceae bacterium GXIMD 01537]